VPPINGGLSQGEAQAGVPVKDPCRKHGFSDAAFYGWRAKFGGKQGSHSA
jgi:putative transposase